MSASPLQSLSISYLRGSTAEFLLPFDPHKKLTIVYGENASGKSTVCDGLELLGAGTVGSLEGRGLGRTGQYWPSIGRGSSDIVVRLKARDGEHRAAVGSSGSVVIDPNADRPRVDILRRSKMAALVTTTEANRFQVIAPFIDVSAVQDGEAALAAALRSASREREIALARISEDQDAVENFWDQSGKPGADAVTWARAQFPRNAGIQAPIAALTQLTLTYDQLLTYPERIRTAATLVSERQANYEALQTTRTSQAPASVADSGETLQILEAADHFLANHPSVDACPLCESTERVAGLADSVRERLSSLANLQTQLRAEQEAYESIERGRQRLRVLEEELRASLARFTSAQAAADVPSGTPMPTSSAAIDAEALAAWLVETATIRSEWDRVRSELEEDERFFGALEATLQTFDQNVLRELELSDLIPALERALEIVSEERHQYVEDKLKTIATEVGRMYEKVHPGEGLEKMSLRLNPSQRASLVMGASFAGLDNVPPQAYFSDSHLDTLSLCIFVALAKLDSPDEKILVLDDVLGSVDEPHVDRLVEMVYEEAANFRHCVITTHYKPWREKYRWGQLRIGECHFIELSRWNSTEGIVLGSTLTPEFERLGSFLEASPPDTQAIASKAGVILEAILDFLTLLYECSVPRKRGDEYTLGDLLPNVRGRLRDALRVEVLTSAANSEPRTYREVELKPILEKIQDIAQARNALGAHFKEISFHLQDADAVNFGKAVLELAETLIDNENGFPRSDRSGSYWATSGETRRLHPLKRPS